MGLSIKDIIKKEEISLEDLNGKIVAVDAFNVLYQFITTIRQHDGKPLMDSKGNVTSHLSGIFYRTTNMMSRGIKPVFVFDGEAPELKQKTREKRTAVKRDAQEKFDRAESGGDKAKYASRISYLTGEMIDEAKEVIEALGLPVVQAPSEGEAQASFMVQQGDAFAVASQDYDSLLFGAPRLIQNLTLAKTRKLPSGLSVAINPQMIELGKVMKELGLTREQLICLGILVGTDYNPRGIPGIGQKTALKIVKQHKTPEEIFDEIGKEHELNFDWKAIFALFMKPKVIKDYKIKFNPINEEKLKEILVERHEFGEERISAAVKRAIEMKRATEQKSIKKFF
ncbi:MAG: flap endonuclease-1 [Nanoarchaeota archaeon]|nr:flap endonuclease-1 [Nanoarchaeota archaeon]